MKNFIVPIILINVFLNNSTLNAYNSWEKENIKFQVDLKGEGIEIPKTLYGIFFEDINFAADGGLYAEKIKNRSFDFPNPLTGWIPFGEFEILNDGPFEKNPNFLRLKSPDHHEKHTGIENEGFFGVSFEKDKEYRFSVWAKVPSDGKAKLKVQLTDPGSLSESQDMGSSYMEIEGKDWKKYSTLIKAHETVSKGRLTIFLVKPEEAVDLEHVSLFPIDTWKGHENGLRKDLVEKLDSLHPGVLRFPGGCIVEGTDLNSRYQWKNSIGPIENRPLNENRWQYTFPQRFYPDYYQSYGLGFYEFFLLSEELGAEPLPVLSVGLSCQFQNKDEKAHVPIDSLQPYIDDALDLIEFANGDSDSYWGKVRIGMGHPEPFNLKYIGLGNEQWDTLYTQRLKPFVKAIKEKYPEIKIIGSSGPDSEGRTI